MNLIINQNTPINYNIVKKNITNSGIKNIGKASIRELVKLVNNIEQESGSKYIIM